MIEHEREKTRGNARRREDEAQQRCAASALFSSTPLNSAVVLYGLLVYTLCLLLPNKSTRSRAPLARVYRLSARLACHHTGARAKLHHQLAAERRATRFRSRCKLVATRRLLSLLLFRKLVSTCSANSSLFTDRARPVRVVGADAMHDARRSPADGRIAVTYGTASRQTICFRVSKERLQVKHDCESQVH